MKPKRKEYPACSQAKEERKYYPDSQSDNDGVWPVVHSGIRQKAITVLPGQQREDESMHTCMMTHAHNGEKAGHRVGVQEASLERTH